MRILKKPIKVEKFGIAIRIITNKIYKDKPYGVEFAPLYVDEKKFDFKRCEFGCFGGSVGIYFKTFKEARRFFNDIISLNKEEMLEKYPNIWVE